MSLSTEELTIASIAFGGDAVGRRECGKVCFLEGALPGEKVKVQIVAEKKNYSYARIVEVLEKSPRRIISECSCECPSCPYRNMDYALELEWKNKQLLAFADRLKKMQVKNILSPVGAPERHFWRNKVSFHLSGNGVLSYVGRDNTTLVPVKNCLLAHKEIQQFIEKGEWKKELEKGAEKITFRRTQKDGVVFYTDKSRKKRVLTESLGDSGDFQVEMHSFFQINNLMAQKLAEAVLLLVEKCNADRLLELYCGCGVFSILAAEKYSLHCCGIELDESSIHLAKENARLHNVEKFCSFYAGDAGKIMKKLYGNKLLPSKSLLLVDPPRTGLAPNALEMLLSASSDYILYISCGPASLMRDLELLAEKYETEEMQLFDLFPSTGHFETLVLLKRNT